MTNIELGRQFSDSRINSIVQDGEETMLFATSRGLLKYDGSSWERIITPSPVLRVYHHRASNRVFVGMRSGAAEVIHSDSGSYRIKAIPGFNSKQLFQHILGTEKEVYFVGESEVFKIDPNSQNKAVQIPFPEKLISAAFFSGQSFYLLFYQEGLFELNSGKLKSVGNFVNMAEDQMLFSFDTENGTYLGFENDAMYRFKNGSFYPIAQHLRTFITDNVLSDALLLNDSLMAISSLGGGAVVANIYTNRVNYRFDYGTGARDNEIFCLGRDEDDGLWLAYESGLSRVDLAQPIKNFSGYPGMEGSLTASLVVKDLLYVGTGNGVFVLKEATSKAEVDRMVDEMMRRNEASENAREESDQQPMPQLSVEKQEKKEADLIERYQENPEAVKEELSRKELRDLKKEIRKQRKGNNKKDDEQPIDPVENTETEVKPETVMSREPVASEPTSSSKAPSDSKVTSVSQTKNKTATEAKTGQGTGLEKSFLYRKINGIDVKCRQLLNFGDQVFAATGNGLYAIREGSSVNLTPGLYINHVSVSKSRNKLLLATSNGVYELMRDASGRWIQTALSDSTPLVAYNVTQDANGTVWAGSDNGAYQFSSAGVTFHSMPDGRNERVLVTNTGNKIHLLTPSGVFVYDPSSKKVSPSKIPEVPYSDRLEFVLGDKDMIWVRSDTAWHVINGKQFEPMLQYLRLFEDIRHLSTDKNGTVYIIDRGRNLYSVNGRKQGAATKFNIYIRQVSDANGQAFSLRMDKIESEGGVLVFNVAAPFYLKSTGQSTGTEYQYRIEGHRNKWSNWSDKTVIEPGNFSPGDYVLEVRARNVLGEVSDIRTLVFSIPQPLLLRWYFILFYVLVLVGIVYGIIKYRERSLKETQRILEDKVAQRTADLAKAKDQAEKLLLNILPKETAQELQISGKATARHYNQVSVLFTDFKGFTQFAENTKPQELVNELHRCFVSFDEIIGKYFLEKIKTIGDAYMCAGGVPIRNNSNAIAITLAGLEIRDEMLRIAEEKRLNNEPVLEIRIGIHTGPLTAGVVGLKKFAYDIWGDTVNTASRMETASEPGKVNVSGITYDLIKKYFECEYRGHKEVKGKGLVEMYFVNQIKPEFSIDGLGKEANESLWELIR